jgi:regulatory protein
MAEKSELIKAETKAFRLLTLRAHSEKELRSKLNAVHFSPEVVDDVVQKCVKLGYLNDETFAKQRARSLGVNRLVGDLKISFDLKERGVSSDIRTAAIADIDRELDEKERIRKLIRKRRRANNAGLPDEKQKARLIRNLMSRGFPLALIMKTITEEEEQRVHDDDGE